MDLRLKKSDSKNSSFLKNHGEKLRLWIGKRFVLGKYSYSRRSLFLVAATFLLLAAVSYYSFYYFSVSRDPNLASKREIKEITKKISAFMELPQGEEPTLATVSDREKIKDQQFFANAQNGDKVLVYPKAKKAILFRPSTGKIIEIANLSSGSREENPSSNENGQSPEDGQGVR